VNIMLLGQDAGADRTGTRPDTLMVASIDTVTVVGIVWALQIVLANLAHSTRERLAGAKRYLALALAALMVVGVALPFGRGVQSLWALQGLMGSESVFGGGEGGDHPFTSGKDPWANTERVNIMLLGQDAGADRTGTRPDTLMVASIDTVTVVGIVWALQIVLANLAHSTRERLAGAKRYLALALAALMVVGVALPFGRGVQSLWALQGLMGSESVFGGGEGGDHPFTSGKDPWANTERVNIMLLGQDAGADRTGTRPDTLMVASIDTATGQTALFSIPRNLEGVEFPEGTPAAEEFPDGFDYFGRNQNLINAVWTWAEDRPDLFPNDPEPGLTATRWAVEETLGLEMDYYAMVNLQGFEDLVDALGGVEMVVERRIPIGGGASEVEGYIEPGEQTLDGFHALWYARSREGSNDFNRMCRQQRIVRAVSEEADPTTLALSIPRLVNATEDNIVTDIPVSNLDAFVDLALRVKDGGFTSYPITQDVTFSGNPDWEYLEEWTAASIEDSMEQDPPESVLGETEPGSTEPAETGAPPEDEEGTGSEKTRDDGESSSSKPEIEKDPLKSCLPGYEE